MRIFLSLLPSANLSVPNNQTWLYNLYEPLLDIGHEVYLLRIDEAAKFLKAKNGTILFKEKFSDYILQTFKKEHKKKKFDLFLSYFQDKHIFPQILDEIRKIGVPTANFSCNNTHQFYLTGNIAPHFDFNLHSEKSAGDKFLSIGAKPIWFQMAANPKYYHPIKCDYKYDVSFIGSSYAKRANYIHQLLSNNIDVHCFGPNWLINKPHEKLKKIHKEIIRCEKLMLSILTVSAKKRYSISSEIQNYDLQCFLRSEFPNNLHYPISDSDMIKLYSESKINLGFLEVFSSDNDAHSSTKQHLHLREFEVPMCGGLYITNYSDELAEHYEPDKEVLVFHNVYELIDKLNYYLTHEKEAKCIRKAAYNRSIKCHTYQERYSTLFTQLKL